MDNLIDLKAIWHTGKPDTLPTAHEMLQTIRRFRGQKLKSKWLVIVSSCLLFCLIIGVLLVVQFELFTTYLGGCLMAVSCIILAATNLRSLKRFNKLEDCSNLEFLAFIEQTRQNQIYYYKKTQVLIMLLTSVGLLFYMYELTVERPAWFISIYIICVVYLLIIWFWVRPRYFRKNAEKLNATRQRLESISQQLK